MLVKLPQTAISTGGTIRIAVTIPVGSKLVSVAAIDGNTPNLEMRIDLCDASDNINATELSTIPLLHATQNALLTVCYMPFKPLNVDNWRQIVVTYFGTTIGDLIAMAVGVDA
jgi:hypothetical protein